MFPSLVSLTATLLAVVSLATHSSAERLAGRVLIYSYTDGFRHDSIPTAIQALKKQGPSINVLFDATEEKSWFNDTGLAQYDAILFLDTTGDFLDAPGVAALQRYLNLGGNFVGIHAASAGEYNTSYYGAELGAYFDYHPALCNATIDVLDSTHPSTSMLPAQWHVQDEMYNFLSDPRSVGAVVVLSADIKSYHDTGTPSPKQGTPHPTAWYQEKGAGVTPGDTAGRSYYTSLGHLNETWSDPLFLGHVKGAITWTLESNTTKLYNPNAKVGSTVISTFPLPSTSSSSSPAPTSSVAPIENKSNSGAYSDSKIPLLVTALGLLIGTMAWLS
ncbi:hypothetical protein JAAARDRAFT_35868 [Jaapia argillacea MUCL 33604]|uniref:ThuA-like domain-containing protein n=1 Tax=Jaapia argillacea MUCL 33604 TaxID=933084 RepID=A0A067Q171_9AGAM|nr:hypothetical protein JAAARDRAFT_35868 [Jaapia argillacea MUCL 33604]